ncbi:MAG: phosphoadenosine phosphosulfate reductase family protein [Halobacteriota archaeon]|nr:phosphoadenosine phosphosulfate reductase family protein [Halobacteriota archaeon]
MKRSEFDRRMNWTLPKKIEESKKRIVEWYEAWEGNVYISFSGGKDSTVLADLVWSIFPKVPAVFANTGMEYPEIVKFVKEIKQNHPVKIIHPEITFPKVIENYGYPVISKKISRMVETLQNPSEKNQNLRRYYLHGIRMDGVYIKQARLPKKWHKLIHAPFKISDKCCNHLKKNPFIKYEKETNNSPLLGIMAYESKIREGQYLKKGCNDFGNKRPRSWPISFWREKDIWNYIKLSNLPYSDIYNKGLPRTGCMFCLFGVHMEKESRFEIMKRIHPKLYSYCIEELKIGEVMEYLEIPLLRNQKRLW